MQCGPGRGGETTQRRAEEHDPVVAARERVEALQHPGDGEVEEGRLVQVGDLELDAPFPQALLDELALAGGGTAREPVEPQMAHAALLSRRRGGCADGAVPAANDPMLRAVVHSVRMDKN